MVLEGRSHGGGIVLSPGGGSRYGTVLELTGPEATRFACPGCLMIVPAIFFTSGLFSLVLDFCLPSSDHGHAVSSCRLPTPVLLMKTAIWLLEEGALGILPSPDDGFSRMIVGVYAMGVVANAGLLVYDGAASAARAALGKGAEDVILF